MRPHTYADADDFVTGELNSRKRRTKAVLHHPGKRVTDRSWSIYTAEKQLQGPQ